MNYRLNNPQDADYENQSIFEMFRKFLPLLKDEKVAITGALVATFINSGINLAAPILLGHAVDTYIVNKSYPGVLHTSLILLGCFIIASLAEYVKTLMVGGVGQRVLYKLRNGIFMKLQELPVAFFNQNKAGDLISRINNDTDKLNEFFSRTLMQFMGNVFMIIGSGIFLLVLHPNLGATALIPALALLVITRLLSPWIKKQNAWSLQTTGGLAANIQESLENFKVIVAFNRRDYFRKRLSEVNEGNYRSGVLAGVANNLYTPLYGFSSTAAQLIVIGYGTYLITHGQLTLGLLISYLTYVTRFYDPLRQMAAVWSNFQLALAAWERISGILSMQSDMKLLPASPLSSTPSSPALLSFHNVSFGYPDGKEVLHKINLSLEAGKTYALVGPTGGGKTTTASLMARLYDPTEGIISLHGVDLRSVPLAERTKRIGFILQEPFLFTGTVRENILYGNEEYRHITNDELLAVLQSSGLHTLLERFEQGLATPVSSSKDATSLGQRQLIAFIRAALRKPELLILDEATANIDTVTEQLLQQILEKLPKETTRVVIAHRLNTIENADEIYFVNGGEVKQAGSLNEAMNMLMHGHRKS